MIPIFHPRLKTTELSWTGLKENIRRFIVACMCVEKCRFCDRELALSPAQPQHKLLDDETPQTGETKNSIKDCDDRILPNDQLLESPSKPLPEKRYAAIFQTYNARKTRLPEEKNSLATGTRKALKVVQEKLKISDAALESFKSLQEPIESLKTELIYLSKSATHAELEVPAFIHFARQPEIPPRLSECLCQTCWSEMELEEPTLEFCRLFANLMETPQRSLPIASGVNYKGKAKELIRSFKYDGDSTLAADLASLMVLGITALSDHMPATNIAIVPVPLHSSRMRTRGYNQAELLAKELGKLTNLPTSMDALQRKRATKPQQLLGREKRLENVGGAFVGRKKLLQGKSVILVDDVCTSGSTLTACAEEVLSCGALSVVALTVARAILAHDN